MSKFCFFRQGFAKFNFSQFIVRHFVKGIGLDFFWSGSPMNHFQKQGKIHLNQKKQQNPCKIAEIMKQKGFWQVSFWWHS